MRVLLVCPAPPGSRLGNRVTALRWKRLLGELGHRVAITTGMPRGRHDVLVALHARHSAEAVRATLEADPGRPIVVALTGTDLYRDILHDASARRSLDLADILVVLHDRGALALPRRFREKVRVVRQSADPPRGGASRRASRSPRTRRPRIFTVAFVAHLRPEKDPLRAALAARALPDESRIRIVHAGRALSEDVRIAARAEQEDNPRYRWLGEVSPVAARALITRAQLLVLTSVMEGGANVLGEAIVSGTPIVASRIPAAVAALGAGYPGLFPVGNTAALARLLARAERDPSFLEDLARRTRARRALFSVAAEKSAWRKVLADVTELNSARRAGGRSVRPRASR